MCRYTMLISFSIFSSLLFCFTFSFLFSLCILGSPLLRFVKKLPAHLIRKVMTPLLRDVYDPDEHTQVSNKAY